MKPDTLFLLENAAWPALLVNNSGVICRANEAAMAQFGALTEGSSALGASIWSPENETTAEVFLARLERSPTAVTPIKFRLKEGGSGSFLTHICPLSRDGQRLFVFQLFKQERPAFGTVPPGGTPDARSLPGSDRTKAAGSAGALPGQPGGLSFEAGLAHKQKLECALQLIRTVALDFNNALTSILGHTSLILSKIESNHPWRNSLLEVEKSAEKAAEIAQDLAAFSRPEKDTQAQVAGNLNDLVRRTVELFRSSATAPVKWALELETRLYTVNFEEAKMQQAFVKILDNAVQALGGEGKIVVRTKNRDVHQPLQDGFLRLSPGHYVCVEFEDTGSGITPDVLPRIFEPFFTTKNGPAHRGLGLAWVYGIVTNHGGSIGVSSTPGRGTSVQIYVPAVQKFVRDSRRQDEDLTGNETILMIDDEDILLTLGETVLSSFGYRVLTANSGPRALEIFTQAPHEIDLVITDMVMPLMSGRELIERLRKVSPNVKVICSSGYVRARTPEEEEIYLQKPFTSQELLRKVKQALSQDSST